MADVDKTLAERGSRYGDFAGHAKITQGLKRVFIASPMWNALTDSMKEALEMVAHKIGRVLNGDPTYVDSWHDMQGYPKLVEDELTAGTPTTPTPPAPKNITVTAPANIVPEPTVPSIVAPATTPDVLYVDTKGVVTDTLPDAPATPGVPLVSPLK